MRNPPGHLEQGSQAWTGLAMARGGLRGGASPACMHSSCSKGRALVQRGRETCAVPTQARARVVRGGVGLQRALHGGAAPARRRERRCACSCLWRGLRAKRSSATETRSRAEAHEGVGLKNESGAGGRRRCPAAEPVTVLVEGSLQGCSGFQLPRAGARVCCGPEEAVREAKEPTMVRDCGEKLTHRRRVFGGIWEEGAVQGPKMWPA